MSAEAPTPDVLSVVIDPATADIIADKLEQRLTAWIPRSDELRDPEAEGLLIRARLSGDVDPAKLPELRREYFSVDQHGLTWALARDTLDFRTIGAGLLAAGYRGPSEYLIAYLRDSHEPQTPLVVLEAMAETVRRLWWARRWHAVLQQLDLLVCASATTHADLITQAQLLERLREVAKETKQ